MQRARILSLAEMWFNFATALKVFSLLGVCSNRKPGKQPPQKEANRALKTFAVEVTGAQG